MNYTQNAYDNVFLAGKVCRMKELLAIDALMGHTEDKAPFIKHLIESGHDSVLEHASYSFVIEGISRNCSHQLVRHRISSFSQYSHRGSDTLPQVIIPESIKGELLERWKKTCDDATSLYFDAHEQGSTWDDARYILPTGTTTNLMWTINIRSLRNFFKLRLDKTASIEIRELANTIFACVYSLHPAFYYDFLELADAALKGEFTCWKLD